MALGKSDLTPNEISSLAVKVEKLFGKGKIDEEIADDLAVNPSAVLFIRRLLGLRRRPFRDIETQERKLTLDGKNYFRLNPVSIGSIQERLGLNPKKNYGWVASNVKKGEFTVKVEEL